MTTRVPTTTTIPCHWKKLFHLFKCKYCLSLGLFTASDELHWGDEIHWSVRIQRVAGHPMRIWPNDRVQSPQINFSEIRLYKISNLPLNLIAHTICHIKYVIKFCTVVIFRILIRISKRKSHKRSSLNP